MRPPRALVAACWLLCAGAFLPTPATAQSPGSQLFVGRTWVSTDSTAAPNTLRIFLPDGTLVMDSCSESYRLASWRSIGAQLIEWREDTARIEAEISQPRPNQLRLRLRLRGDIRDEHYQLAKVPFVCPDTRLNPAPAKSSVSDRAPGIVSPAPAAYRCGNATYRIAFEARLAFVTLPDGLVMTLKRMNPGAPPGDPRRFSDGRLTFVHAGGASAAAEVSFARGRMALVPCTPQN